MVFKIFHGLVNLNFSDFFGLSNPRTRNFAQFSLKSLYVPSNNVISGFFSHRTISLWNRLPSEIRTAPSLHFFTNKIRSLPSSEIIQSSQIRI